MPEKMCVPDGSGAEVGRLWGTVALESAKRPGVPHPSRNDPCDLSLEPLKGQGISVRWPDKRPRFPCPLVDLGFGVKKERNESADNVAHLYLGI